jgi:hypothetical protein
LLREVRSGPWAARPRRDHRNAHGWIAVAAAVLLLTAGCSQDGGDELDALSGDAPPPSVKPQTSVTSGDPAEIPVDSDERVLADYKAYWGDVVAVRAAGKPTAARVRAHTTGFRYGELQTEIAKDRELGRVAKGEPKLLDPRVDERRDGRAIVVDCLDSNQWLFHDRKTGKLIDKPSGRTYPVSTQLKLVGDVWKVESMIIDEEGKCDG